VYLTQTLFPPKNFSHPHGGFFQDEKSSLVQKYQSFYNIDPVPVTENILTPGRSVEPASTPWCWQRSFVLELLCYETKRLGSRWGLLRSIGEDYFTGIRISALGYRLDLSDEKLIEVC